MTGIKVCIISFILTLVYIFATVSVTNLIFYNKSNGSLIKFNDSVVGSRLIGQSFSSNLYFHGRPSFNKYKHNISGNSNYSYLSKQLKEDTLLNYGNFLKLNQNIKPDLNLITESASGLDPHITYNGALIQVERISRISGLKKEKILEILEKSAKPRILGLFGEKIVNVLEINLGLKELYDKTP